VTVLTSMLHAIDLRDWQTVRDSLGDEVRTDYSSLFGGAPETVPADELVARWRSIVLGCTATQHQSSPVVTTVDTLTTHVVAYHWLDDAPGGDTWVVHGRYVAKLTEGKITELTLQTFRQTGNRDLPSLATARATARQ